MIRWILLRVLLLLMLVAVAGVLFLYISPQFGGSVSDEQAEAYKLTGHFEDGVFTNAEPVVMEINCHSLQAMIDDAMNQDPHVAPDHEIQVLDLGPAALLTPVDTVTTITWLGHSSFLIQMEGIDVKALDEEFDLRSKGYTSLVMVSVGAMRKATSTFLARHPSRACPSRTSSLSSTDFFL